MTAGCFTAISANGCGSICSRIKAYYFLAKMREVMKLKIKELFCLEKPPCDRCPYRLGLVHTLANPCPQCRENHYGTFDWFRREWLRECPVNENKQAGDCFDGPL